MLRCGAFLSLLALVGCGAVDRRPPFETPRVLAALDAIQGGAPPIEGRGPYRAGWAKAKLEAPDGVPLGGFGDRHGAPHVGERDPTYVRAIALAAGDAQVLLFSADLLLIDEAVAERVYAALGAQVAPGSLFFSASHTHSGMGGYVPGLLYGLVFGPYSEAARDAVVKAHVDAARGALEHMVPVRVGTAEVESPGLIMNRIEKGGPTDDVLWLLSVEALDGKSSAAWWSFGCHAVTRNADNLDLSADFPGDVARALEGQVVDQLGFAAGGVGSSNPRYETADPSWMWKPLVRDVSRALVAARSLAQAEGSLSYLERRVRTPEMRYRVEKDLMLWRGMIEGLTDMPSIRFRALALDDAVILQMPGEMSGMVTRVARARARRVGIRLVVTPFNGSYAGYVPPSHAYDLPEERWEELQPYETRVLNFFGKYGADLMMNMGLRLAARTRAANQTQESDAGDW